MRRVIKLHREIATNAQAVWARMSDLDEYPRHFKYVKRVQKQELRVGETWLDWTNILFVTIKVAHQVKSLEAPRLVTFVARTPFGGSLTETFAVDELGQTLRVNALIEIDLRLLDFFIGRFLEKRLAEMISGALDVLERELSPQQ